MSGEMSPGTRFNFPWTKILITILPALVEFDKVRFGYITFSLIRLVIEQEIFIFLIFFFSNRKIFSSKFNPS